MVGARNTLSTASGTRLSAVDRVAGPLDARPDDELASVGASRPNARGIDDFAGPDAQLSGHCTAVVQHSAPGTHTHDAQ